jgi:hypothetical protein
MDTTTQVCSQPLALPRRDAVILQAHSKAISSPPQPNKRTDRLTNHDK